MQSFLNNPSFAMRPGVHYKMTLKKIASAIIAILALFTTLYFASAEINIPSQAWPEDTQHTLNLKSYFPGDAVNFGVATEPSSITLTFNQATGVVTFTPEPNFNGVRQVIFNAINQSNTTQSYSSNEVSLTVTAVSDGPVITSTADTTAEPNTLYQYQVSASDPDGNTLSYSLTQFPGGMAISSSGLISWTPEIEGSYDVTVRVSDGSQSVTQSYSIDVKVQGKLVIRDIEVKVDDKRQTGLDDGDRVSREAKPGSDITIDVEVENLYTRSQDIKITDVEITVRIEDVDDGDDLEETGNTFDLSADRTKTQKFTFQIPTLVDDGDYDLVIEVEGDDEETGRAYRETATLTIEVDNDRHALVITKAALTPETITCQKTASLSVEVTNLGSEDEDDVKIELTAPSFCYSTADEEIELLEGNDEDAIFRKTYAINAATLPEGIYPITVKAYYDGDNLEDAKIVSLNVEKCGSSASTSSSGTGSQAQPGNNNQPSTSQPGGIRVEYTPSIPTGGVTAVPVGQSASSDAKDALYVALLLLVVLIILAVAIYIFKLAFGKKE